MSRLYKVSADMSEKEKIIGGVLTLSQGAWIVCGVLTGGVVFFLLHLFLPPAAALVFALPPGAAVAVVFAFYRREQLPFATWLLYRYQFRKKTKRLPNTLTFRKDFRNQPDLFQ